MKSKVKTGIPTSGAAASAKPIMIYFADLTHTGPVMSAPFHPLGIGLIAAYLREQLGAAVEVELFKYPDDLNRALARRIPDVAGFSNYSWNCNLSYHFAERVKRARPETVVVFGGPNYGTSDWELEGFWRHRPSIDLHVVGEGEQAMVEIVRRLIAANMDFESLRRAGATFPSSHYVKDGAIVKGDMLSRIRDLATLPSPYLEGLMDKFFDDVLVPLIHTTRGCPFRCTFCTEGADYYNKVIKRYDLADELEYIAKRVGQVPELMISDANFGMFKEDRLKAQQIAAMQEKYDWPKFVQVNGGKNQKERLMEVSSILKGRMRVSAALQTTNDEVLKNIKRNNISYGELRSLGEHTRKIDARADLELILGLPGDSLLTHTQSLHDGVGSGIATLRIHQLILLPQTEMNLRETREKFDFRTRYRLMPRSFGRYECLGEKFAAVEFEEIVISNSTMAANDYLDCRELDLTIEITHNGRMYQELMALCQHTGIDWFDVIYAFHRRRRELGPEIAALYDEFRADNRINTRETSDALVEHVTRNMDAYFADSRGTNEMAKAKTAALMTLQEKVHNALYAEAKTLLDEAGELTTDVGNYVDQLRAFSWRRKEKFLDVDARVEGEFDYDFNALLRDSFADSMSRLGRPERFVFEHDDEQKRLIHGYFHEHGRTLDGIGRIFMLAPVQRMLRKPRQTARVT